MQKLESTFLSYSSDKYLFFSKQVAISKLPWQEKKSVKSIPYVTGGHRRNKYQFFISQEPRSVHILFPDSYAPSRTHRVNTQPRAINSTIQKLNILYKTDRILKGQHAISWKNQIVLGFCSVTPGYLIITKSTTASRQPATNIEWAVRNQGQELGDQGPWKPWGPALWLLQRKNISCFLSGLGATGELFQWLEMIYKKPWWV